MANSWGHTLRPLTESEIKYQIDGGKSLYEWRIKNPGVLNSPQLTEDVYIHRERKCRISSKCQNESTHMLRYYYITGRGGRTSCADKPVCDDHAKKYVDQNN